MTTLSRTWTFVQARLGLLSAVLAGCALLAWQRERFPYRQDDAYISFAYGRYLAEHGRLVYRLDETVEGYSNFLWTLLSAGAHAAVGPSAILGTMRAVAFACALCLIAVVAFAASEKRTQSGVWAPLALGSATALALHVNAVLETVSFTLAVTGGFVLLRRALRARASPAAGLACFVLAAGLRFDGVVPLAMAVVFVALRGGRGRLRWVAAAVLLYATYFGWRLWYYDSLWPNTVTAKLSASFPIELRLEAGARYVADGVHGLGLYWLVPGAVWWMIVRRRHAGEWLGALLVAWFMLEAFWVGGDWMSGFRFLWPAVPILLIQALAGYGRSGSLRWLSAVPALAFSAWAQWVVPVTAIAKQQIVTATDNGDFVASVRRVAVAFADKCSPEDELATDVAGVFAYFTSCRVLDTWGLASRETAERGRAPDPRAFETYGVVAPEVVLERRPRFILPFPPVLSSEGPELRTELLRRITPEHAFSRKKEMKAYRVAELRIETAIYEYFERR